MRRKLILIGLICLIIIMPTSVRAFPELTHDTGTEILNSGSIGGFPGTYCVFHYTIYDDVAFGGYFNITDDVDLQGPTAEMSWLHMFILNAENWAIFPSNPSQCDRLFEVRDINITAGRVAWNYTQYTSVEYDVSIVYWYYRPTPQNERQITLEWEHWDWARYQPPVETIIITTTTITTTETTSETITEDTTTTDDPNTTFTPNGEATALGFIILGIVGVIGIAVIGVTVSKRGKKVETISKDAKVFVICPYCGSKTEQGIIKCQKCGADL